MPAVADHLRPYCNRIWLSDLGGSMSESMRRSEPEVLRLHGQHTTIDQVLTQLRQEDDSQVSA